MRRLAAKKQISRVPPVLYHLSVKGVRSLCLVHFSPKPSNGSHHEHDSLTYLHRIIFKFTHGLNYTVSRINSFYLNYDIAVWIKFLCRIKRTEAAPTSLIQVILTSKSEKYINIFRFWFLLLKWSMIAFLLKLPKRLVYQCAQFMSREVIFWHLWINRVKAGNAFWAWWQSCVLLQWSAKRAGVAIADSRHMDKTF
jgi:hypothetical protein